jgi:predicted alpha/beta-hydrolase family hydrolase
MAPRRGPAAVDAVALWPGAGSDSDHPTLLAIESALSPLPVRRFDFPYRREGRRAPNRAERLIASIVEDVGALCEELHTQPDRVVLGGRSMGGRMCSMAVAEGLPTAGLVLIAYPLHPPGKPDRLRTLHLDQLKVPSLWICGDRDPFGSPEEIAEAQRLVPGRVAACTLPGRHDLKGQDEAIVDCLLRWLGRRPRSR